MNTLIKLDRIFAWILFVSIILFVLSGYGVTEGIINIQLASTLHSDILPYTMLIAFIIHTSFAIHLAFKRWGFWDKGGKIVLILGFVIFISGFVYLESFYHEIQEEELMEENLETNQIDASTNLNTATTIASPTPSATSTTKIFTVAELAKYNGKNGTPAYVAIDGNVYDLSSTFKEGKHYSHLAGTDLTQAFYSEHAKSILNRFPIVGILQK